MTTQTATAPAKVHCPSCNAEIPRGAAECASCGQPLPSSVSVPETTAGEKGWGSGARSFKCEGCGAEVVITSNQLKFTCAYCGNERVLEQPAGTGGASDDVRPSFLLPFRVQKTETIGIFQKWTASLWFAPGDLSQMAQQDRIRGVYLPFWCYDTQAHTYYNGEYGINRSEYYYETENGQQVQKSRIVTDWYPRWGWSDQSYENVLVVASQGVDRGMSVQLEPFELKELARFSSELLAGWEAERYALDHSQAWDQYGAARVTAAELLRCTDLVRGGADHVRGVRVEPHFTRLSSEHLLLPVYVSAFNYRGKVYHFLVNGQTAKVTGERPWSFWKIFFLVLSILAVVVAIIYFATHGGGGAPPPSGIHGR